MDWKSTVWHTPNKDDPNDAYTRATQLVSETASIETRQSSWHELNLWNSVLFTNRELPGFRWGEIVADRELWPINLRTENLIEEIGEAMLSKASMSPMRPSLVPHGMSWKTEKAVRLADNFVFGVWRQSKAEEACIHMFLDAFLCGVGCVRAQFDEQANKLIISSVFFDNVIIDNRECTGRQMPRTYRIREVLPRKTVEARYNVTLDDAFVRANYVDFRSIGDGWVVVVTAWRMPDSKGEGGYEMTSCCGKILKEEKYTDTEPPLVFFKWQDNPSGWFCKSGVEQLIPYQNRQNDLNDAIELSQDIVCRPRLLLNANSMIDINQWDNEAGRFLLYSGAKPEPFEWRTNLSDLYHERDRNAGKAYSHVGMSEMFTNADLPEGVRLDSSAGVREFQNMEDKRHLRLWTRFQNARLDVGKLIMRVLGKHSGAAEFKAVYRIGKKTRTAEFKALKALKDDQYSWSLEAVPLSSQSPAARRELIRDWSSRGLVDPDSGEARRSDSNPNLERDEVLEMSSRDDITRHISVLEESNYEPPSPMTNCTYGIQAVTANYHRLKDYEEYEQQDEELIAILQNHIKWVLQATSIVQTASQPQAPMTPFAPTQGQAGPHGAVGDAAQ